MSEVLCFMSWLNKFKKQSTDEKSVVEFFSDVKTHKQLCMPAVVEIINTERFALSGNVSKKFSYFGRHAFARLVIDFKDMLNKNKSVLRVLGNIGAGKSHMLAAFAIYMHYMRSIDSTAKRVVYIPSCSSWSTDPVGNMMSALNFAFDETELKSLEMLIDMNDEEGWSAIKNFIRKQPKRYIVFVCDDWNFMYPEQGDDDADVIMDLRKKIESLTASQYRIEALSAGSAEAARTKGKGFDRTSFFELFGGLSDMEWTAWVEHHASEQDREQGAEDSKFWASIERTQQQQQLRGGLEANENSPMDIAEDGVSICDLDRLRDFTGGVPLNLRNFLRCHGGTMDEKVDAFTEGKTFGEQIVSDLRNFTRGFSAQHKIHLKPDHVSLMQRALIESKSDMDLNLIDQRYFFHKDGAVHPVSGFVRKTMAIILQNHARKEYFAGLTPDWVRSALESKNPIVCGFAYEEFCLALIYKDPSRLHPTLSGVKLTIKRFDGNAPPSSQLNVDGCVLFWPNKFNLRHVDAVLRWVTTDSYPKTSIVSSSISSSNATKKRKTVASTETKQVETGVTVFAIQVTLQTPVAHKRSLKFVEQDALAYMRNGETALHHFIWVVRERSTTPECDRDDVLQHLSVITTD